MATERRPSSFLVSVVAGLTLLLLNGCGSPGEPATPTLSFEAISTFAFQTVSAEMATDEAAAPPTEAPAPTALPLPVPTFALPSPIPTLSFASSTPSTGGASDCDDSSYIADVTVPDNTRFDPGEKFVKTWQVQNTGTCPWTTSYKLVFVDGLEMEGSTTYVPLPVPVGQQTPLSVSMRAPTSPGQYYGRWKMRNANDQAFGSILTVVIKVEPLEPTAAP